MPGPSCLTPRAKRALEDAVDKTCIVSEPGEVRKKKGRGVVVVGDKERFSWVRQYFGKRQVQLAVKQQAGRPAGQQRVEYELSRLPCVSTKHQDASWGGITAQGSPRTAAVWLVDAQPLTATSSSRSEPSSLPACLPARPAAPSSPPGHRKRACCSPAQGRPSLA